jgi:hypothetical protein
MECSRTSASYTAAQHCSAAKTSLPKPTDTVPLQFVRRLAILVLQSIVKVKSAATIGSQWSDIRTFHHLRDVENGVDFIPSLDGHFDRVS